MAYLLVNFIKYIIRSFLVVYIFFIATIPAFAAISYDRTPAGATPSLPISVDFTANILDIRSNDNDLSSTFTMWLDRGAGNENLGIANESFYLADVESGVTFTFTDTGLEGEDIIAVYILSGCVDTEPCDWDNSFSWGFEQELAAADSFTIFDPTPPSEDVNFILGTTSPMDLFANVTGGVQTTGGAVWPLLTILGVPVAFTIGGRVISFIRFALG